ncbi:hypothetical protein ACET3Z_005879 [Daucus carota]
MDAHKAIPASSKKFPVRNSGNDRGLWPRLTIFDTYDIWRTLGSATGEFPQRNSNCSGRCNECNGSIPRPGGSTALEVAIVLVKNLCKKFLSTTTDLKSIKHSKNALQIVGNADPTGDRTIGVIANVI